jgi:phenylacetate-CoA ligase
MTSPAFANVRSSAQTAVAERMPEHIRRMSWSSEAIAQHQRDRLRELLAHAIAHSPFHAKRLVGTPLSDSYLCLASGGSSGDSGLFVFDVDSFAQFICSIMRPAIVRAASAAGMPATGMPPSGPKVAFVAAASPIHLTHGWRRS